MGSVEVLIDKIIDTYNIIRNDPLTLRWSIRHLMVLLRRCIETGEFHLGNLL